MNCQQAEQWILLKRSGELPFQKQLRLERHLVDCAHCRAYQQDLEQVLSAARQSLPSGEPGVQALTAIREAARAGLRQPASAGVPRQRDAGRPESAGWGRVHEWILVAWRPALAIAAVLLLCLGGWYWLTGRGPVQTAGVAAWEQEAATVASRSEDEIDDMAAMLVEDVVVIERVSDLARQSGISALDRDLLILEGLAI